MPDWVEHLLIVGMLVLVILGVSGIIAVALMGFIDILKDGTLVDWAIEKFNYSEKWRNRFKKWFKWEYVEIRAWDLTLRRPYNPYDEYVIRRLRHDDNGKAYIKLGPKIIIPSYQLADARMKFL